ncbi:MAG: 2OG-Fe(II) oxygenase [Candidatus Thioglobus sp.]
MQDLYVEHIVKRLEKDKAHLRLKFRDSKQLVGTRFCYIDDLLPVDLANDIDSVFPDTDSMRLISNFRERKYTSKDFDQFDHRLKDITFAFQDSAVIELIEYITEIKGQISDNSSYAGGLSSMPSGSFLNPHIDNSHDANRQYYRTLNLLYYITPDWSEGYGGNLELWDNSVKQNTTIFSQFNRLVIMETTPTSWHSVSGVTVERNRNCISNYYFSPLSPVSKLYFNATLFSARPEQKFRRVLAKTDNLLRSSVRKLVPSGVGKKDVYEGDSK